MTTNEEQRYLTTAEAAEYLGLAKRTLDGYRLRGGGPKFYKRGRNIIRYRASDLDDWLREEPQDEWGETC